MQDGYVEEAHRAYELGNIEDKSRVPTTYRTASLPAYISQDFTPATSLIAWLFELRSFFTMAFHVILLL